MGREEEVGRGKRRGGGRRRGGGGGCRDEEGRRGGVGRWERERYERMLEVGTNARGWNKQMTVVTCKLKRLEG